MNVSHLFVVVVILSIPVHFSAWGAEAELELGSEAATDVAAGHSRHGEAFNEGPRQRAYLMSGTGKISFEVSSKVPGVRAFVEQGIGQLHGFWYFEAERSFRQAAMLDPDCAIAYWGMAQANTNNEQRAKGLIEKAKELSERASDRERAYILALHGFLNSEEKKKQREADYVAAIEAIIEQFPEDLEAKALLGYALYKYRASADRSHAEVDVVLDEVLAKSKDHPVHHYRIHLWDHKSPQRALDSAAQCGPAAPGIAHMWHMCGHIFSRVKRYGDAAWFQEASARVDHRHMMHDQVLPDQIHNFAHNNEWFIRNMMNVGRVRDALDLAKNMIELPRHPKYNMLDERNSASYGRDRLINVLERFELWEQAIQLAEGTYLQPTDDPEEQLKRLRLLGKAYARTGRIAEAEQVQQEVKVTYEALQATAAVNEENESEKHADPTGDDEAAGDATTDDAPADAEEDADVDDEADAEEKERKRQQEKQKRLIERAERTLAGVSGDLALAQGRYQDALKLLEEAEEDELSRARVQLLSGDEADAVAAAKKYAEERKNQVHAGAGLVEVLWQAGEMESARQAFITLRANSNWLQMDAPVFQRLTPIAVELGFPADWKVQLPPSDDLGEQPELDALGPFRWQPVPAPDWLLPDSQGALHSLRAYRGKPVVIVFYLGYGCLHCAEQLQALAPQTAAFEQAGIELIAISTDSLNDLDISVRNYEGKQMPFPLVADSRMEIFKAYRCFDDFEAVPLHGTFLIDPEGRIRWQDISYDPFMDLEFLLEESQRLLKQDMQPSLPRTQRLVQQ